MRNLGETLLYKQMPRGSNLAAARAKRAAKRKTKKLRLKLKRTTFDPEVTVQDFAGVETTRKLDEGKRWGERENEKRIFLTSKTT